MLYIILNLIKLSFKLFQNKLYIMYNVERTILKKRISEFIVKNSNTKNSQIINHFVQEGYAYRTVSVNIKRVNEGQAIRDKKRTGRPNKLSSVQLKSLKSMAKDKIGTSSVCLAKKCMVHRTTISKNLKKMGVSYHRRQKLQNTLLNLPKKPKRDVENW